MQGLIVKIHAYIIYLQRRFLAGLAEASPVNSAISMTTLNSQQPEPIRSNGLVGGISVVYRIEVISSNATWHRLQSGQTVMAKRLQFDVKIL